jgi:hypothetical protein
MDWRSWYHARRLTMSWVAWIALTSLLGNVVVFWLIFFRNDPTYARDTYKAAVAQNGLVQMVHGLATDCEVMRRVLIEQEELMARVWLQAFGSEKREGDWWNNRRLPLSESYGKRPAWRFCRGLSGISYDNLERDDERPWYYRSNGYE